MVQQVKAVTAQAREPELDPATQVKGRKESLLHKTVS